MPDILKRLRRFKIKSSDTLEKKYKRLFRAVALTVLDYDKSKEGTKIGNTAPCQRTPRPRKGGKTND